MISWKSLATILFSLSMYGCSLIAISQPNAPNPRIIPSNEVSRIVSAIPSYTRFGYSGLAFFKGNLYASSNIGLLEYNGGALSKLYKWYDRDDVISGPWFDRATQSLWFLHDGINKLIRYDGKVWSMIDMPRPKEGFTRGDMLNGFQGISTEAAFWLQGGSYAWRWDARKGVWESEPMPRTGLFVSITPFKDRCLVIMRHRYDPYIAESPFNRRDKPSSDAVYFFQHGEWQELPNKSGIKFFTRNIVIAKEAAYLLTEDGKLLCLTSSEIAQIKSLGEVEAMTITSSDNLLASFRNNGIYEYADGWHKRFSAPYPTTEAEHWTYLSESNGQVALAITSQPQMAGENKWKYPGQTTLWSSSGSELKPIPLGER